VAEFTTINFIRLSVSDGSGRLMGTLAAAGWAWSLHGKQT